MSSKESINNVINKHKNTKQITCYTIIDIKYLIDLCHFEKGYLKAAFRCDQVNAEVKIVMLASVP